MAPPTVSKASTKYPIFAAAFASNNPGILIVGGGGGAGRSGVPNAITAFNTSSRAPTLEPFAHVDLNRDEDSVTSLSNLGTKDGAILYAGVNSSEAERLKGNNEHFRAFELRYPKGKDGKGRIEYLSKTQLLNPATSEGAKKDGYQRIVKLSPPGKAGKKRIGAVASSLYSPGEDSIVLYAAVSNKPSSSDIIQRIELKQEANDIDLNEMEDGRFQLAYALDHDVYVHTISYDFNKKKPGKKLQAPIRRYSVPYPDVFESSKSRPKIRCIRFLTSSHILLLVNHPNRSGVELQVLRLYDVDGMGSISLRKKIKAKQAVDMDCVRLNADKNGAFQAVIAVTSIDVSLHIYTIDYHGTRRDSLGGFHKFAVYRDVHDVQMTKTVFSPFFAEGSSSGSKPLRLASTSLSGSISIETFALQPTSSKAGTRYILASARNRKVYDVAIYAACAFIALMLALMVQSLVDPEGKLTQNLIPPSLQDAARNINSPKVSMSENAKAKAEMDGAKAPVARTSHRIRDLLRSHREEKHENTPQKAVVIHDDPDTDSSLSAEVHADNDEVVKRHTEAKQWEELSHAERKKWKNKLIDAGMWAVEEGETVLKGIFFSEAAGLVGQVAHGVLNG